MLAIVLVMLLVLAVSAAVVVYVAYPFLSTLPTFLY